MWEELGQREHRLDSLSCGLVFFGVKKWKYVVVDNFFFTRVRFLSSARAG